MKMEFSGSLSPWLDRIFQRRPRALLSADGRTVLNLWFVPHYTEVLRMFRMLDDSVRHSESGRALLLKFICIHNAVIHA